MSRTLLARARRDLFGGAVDFGHEGLQDRRAGRHFGDGDARVVFGGDRRHPRPDAFGDVVALGVAIASF